MFRYISTCAIAILTVLILGCSTGGSLPMTPDDNLGNDLSFTDGGVQEVRHGSDQGNRMPFGFYRLHFDHATKSVTVIPDRGLFEHHDVTGFLKYPECNDCFILIITAWDPVDCIISLNATLKNPFDDISGYDIRMILDSLDNAYKIVNPNTDKPDGYTDLWSIWDETRDPFVAFPKEPPRVAPPLSSHEHPIDFYYPQPPDGMDLEDVLIIIDASHPGNCDEPYEITDVQLGSHDIPESCIEVPISCEVRSWADDVDGVRARIEEEGNQIALYTIDLENTTGDLYEASIALSGEVPLGSYNLWIEAWSSSDPDTKMWQMEEVEVVVIPLPPQVQNFDATDGDGSLDPHEVELTWDPVQGNVDFYDIDYLDYVWGSEWSTGNWEWQDKISVPSTENSWIDNTARYSGSSAPVQYRIKARNQEGSSLEYAYDTGYPPYRSIKLILWCVADDDSGTNPCASWEDGSDDVQQMNEFHHRYGLNFVLQNTGGFLWVPDPKYRIITGSEMIEMHAAYGQIHYPDCLNVYYVENPKPGAWGVCLMYDNPDYHTTEYICITMRGETGPPTTGKRILAHEAGHGAIRLADLYVLDTDGNRKIEGDEDCPYPQIWSEFGWPLLCNVEGCYPQDPDWPNPPANIMWWSIGGDVSNYDLHDVQYIYLNDWISNHEGNYPWP